MTITKIFNYYGEMINYIKEVKKAKKITNCKSTLDQRTKKYKLTYTIL